MPLPRIHRSCDPIYIEIDTYIIRGHLWCQGEPVVDFFPRFLELDKDFGQIITFIIMMMLTDFKYFTSKLGSGLF